MQLSRLRRGLFRGLRAAGILAVLVVVAVFVFSLCSQPIKLAFVPTAETARYSVKTRDIPGYARDEVDTFYTYPEWYIVWSYQAKADFQRSHLPSGYSYFGDIGQFWQAYSRVYAITRREYPFSTGNHIMLAVIGSSFTIEYSLKGLYEETIGRASEWASGGEMVSEDIYAAKVAENYAEFVHIRPFYEYSFSQALRGLWTDTPFGKAHLIRALERRVWLSLDYAVESVYCEMIELATHATYGYEDVNTSAWIEFPAQEKSHVFASVPAMKIVKELSATAAIVEIPRYQEFTTSAQTLIQSGVHFQHICGNGLIVVSAIAPAQWTNSTSNLQLLISQPILTNSKQTRTVLIAKVSDLDLIIPMLEGQGLTIEHLYDY